MKYDLIVAGGGLAGLMAAIFGASRSLKTCLITKGSGILAVGGGNIDVLGYAYDGRPLTQPWDGFADLPSRHPYQIIGSQAVKNSLQEFQTLTTEAGYPYLCHEKNIWVATALGTTKPSYLAPASLTIDPSFKNIYVLGIDGLKDFYPSFVAEGLAKRKLFQDKSLTPLSLPCPFTLERDLSALDLARYLDTIQGIDWLAARIQGRIPSGSLILLPPILGTKVPTPKQKLEERTQCTLAEVVGLPPAVTGLRLHAILLNLLKKYNVDLIEHALITDYTSQNGQCTSLITSTHQQERQYKAKNFIIATGGILGEGFEVMPQMQVNLQQESQTHFFLAQEKIFKLPLAEPLTSGWSKEQVFPPTGADSHGFSLLGPEVDAQLRPVVNGQVLCNNVYFIGKSLGGYDHSREKSGNGVALATAWQAVQFCKNLN